MVLYAALHAYGSPRNIVSDGGRTFTADQANTIHAAFGIRDALIDAPCAGT